MFHRLPHTPGGLTGESAPSTAQFPQPSLLPQFSTNISPRRPFPSPRQAAPFTPPDALRGPPPSQVPSEVHHTPPARRGRPPHAPRPPPTILTSHPPHSRSRRRLRPQQCAHRTRAPPGNTPPARGPLPHMMPGARSARKARGERLAKSGAHKRRWGYQRACG